MPLSSCIAACRAALAAAIISTALAPGASAGEPAKPDPRIGDEVDRICFASTINGFRTIDGADNVVLLEKGVSDLYRVELSGLCTARVLDFAQSVAIDSRPRGGCVTRGDTLIFSGSAFFNDRPIDRTRCFITRINNWDEKAAAPQAGDSPKQ